MFKKSLWIAAVALFFTLSQSALAHQWCGDGLKKMVSSLKLDDAQRAKVMPILDQLKANMASNAVQMRDIEMQLRQQMMSATMDQSVVDGLIDKKTKMIGDAMKAKITAKNQMFNMLTAEQKASMQAMMKKVEDKMAERYKSCHDDN